MKNGKTALYEDLKHQILTMELDPDESLDEVSFSKRYGLSRTPIREVFRQLAGEGYIELHENKGARVSPMNHATLRSFFLVAPMIYTSIGCLAIQNYKPKQLVELEEVQEQFRKACKKQDSLAMAITNNRFHEIIGEMSHNIYLQVSLGRLLIDHCRIGCIFYRSYNEDMQRRIELSVAHHDAFIEAIKARNETAMVDLVFEHWELSRENMEMFIAPESMKADILMT